MASFTRSSRNGLDAPTVVTVILRPPIRLLQTRFRQILQRLVALVASDMLFWWPLAAPAQSIEINRAWLKYADGGWNLSVDFDFDLPNSLEDAVNRGTAFYFPVEFELTRLRWYWFDDHAVSATRVVQLSYHPLTCQYYVSTGGLRASFSRLKDAVDFMQHVRGWRVLEQYTVKAGETVQAEVRMCLDVMQLPKPFQVNVVNTRDWDLNSGRERFNLLVPNEPPLIPSPTPAAPPPSAPASTPPAFGSPGLSPNPGRRMSAGPSSSGTLLALTK